MTDRELLELAAKACGYDTSHSMNARRLLMVPPVSALCVSDAGGLVSTGWSPLEDDAHALRLAVKLNLHVQIDFNEDPAAVYIYGGWLGEGIEESIEECRYAAVRKAITRAAAEIGKTL